MSQLRGPKAREKPIARGIILLKVKEDRLRSPPNGRWLESILQEIDALLSPPVSLEEGPQEAGAEWVGVEAPGGEGGMQDAVTPPRDAWKSKAMRLKAFRKCRDADYMVEKKIGSGSFAQVYRVRDKKDGKLYAMKVLRPVEDFEDVLTGEGSSPMIYDDVIETLYQELQYLQHLSCQHPSGIITVVGVSTDSPVFLMEYADYGDLYNLILNRHESMKMDFCCKIISQTAAGLAFMHRSKICHLDLKSSNLLIDSQGNARICDLGLASFCHGQRPIHRELVTLWYRSPELIMGCQLFSPKVDVWGLGTICLELLLGYPCFQGDFGAVCTCSRAGHKNWNHDQFVKICNVIGTPPHEEPYISWSCYEHWKNWPQLRSVLNQYICSCIKIKLGHNNEDAYACNGDLWGQLIKGCLRLDVHSRFTAGEAHDAAMAIERHQEDVRNTASTHPQRAVSDFAFESKGKKQVRGGSQREASGTKEASSEDAFASSAEDLDSIPIDNMSSDSDSRQENRRSLVQGTRKIFSKVFSSFLLPVTSGRHQARRRSSQ